MNRQQFEHTVRAAGAVLGISDVLVIGSQALHASMSGALPDEASRSVEVDGETTVLPAGWRERLVRFQTPATSGVVAWCREPHDLWVSKAIAGREKDREFCSALVSLDVVERGELTRRLAQVGSLDPQLRTLVQARIDR